MNLAQTNRIALILILCFGATCFGEATITVQTDKPLGPVNRKVMGQMLVGADAQYIWASDDPDLFLRRKGHGIWDDVNHRPNPKVLELLKGLRPGVFRYPGGSEVKNYNWKATVGPFGKRDPDWRWGLMEYLKVCEEVGAEPQICLSEYYGTPEDQRDLVEFLNMPAIATYPWAMKRAEYGRIKPYGVKYFELGNEPNDGNRRAKPRKQWSPEGYIGWALKTIKLTKSVDPAIKLGLPAWCEETIRGVGPEADYFIPHIYAVGYNGDMELDAAGEDRVARACMAAGDQMEWIVQASHEQLRNVIKRDLPLGVTEYNTMFQGRMYRHSLASGIYCADFARRMMQPKNNVLLANYWQMLYGFFGNIRTNEKDDKLIIYAPYYCYRLMAQHLGDTLLDVDVQTPKLEFEGFCEVNPSQGEKRLPRRSLSDVNLLKPKHIRLPLTEPIDIRQTKAGVIRFDIKKFTRETYPGFANIPVSDIPAKYRPNQPGIMYKFTFEGRWSPKPGCPRICLGLGMMDGRGWTAAGSAVAVHDVEFATDGWRKFETIYCPLSDTPSLQILGRVMGGLQEASGVMEVRNLRVTPLMNETYPAYDAVTAMASISKDAKTLYLLVFNKTTDRDIPTTINLPGFAATSVRYWEVNGPSAGSFLDVREVVSGKTIPLESPAKFTHRFPAHSITAVELVRSQKNSR
jgi:alpha-N-arabinofuranosidase